MNILRETRLSPPALLMIPACMLCAAPLSAQDDPAAQSIAELDLELSKMSQELGDWDEQYPLFSTMIENVWARNNWNTEADLFARDTALRIEKIPPWQFQKRLEIVIDTVKQRYTLEEPQVQQFRNQIAREAWNMTLKYGQVMMEQMQESMQTRMRGEPFTPEQVARWADQFEPLLDDWRADIDRIATEFRSGLQPDQVRVFDRDLESLHKRMHYVSESSEAWRNGQWHPADWGLQTDPIHARALQAGQLRPVRRQSTMPKHFETLSIAGDESTWRRYVREFIRYFDLDEPQRNACNAILEDLILRATRYRSSRHQQISEIPRFQRNTHPALEPIRKMFEELKFRLQQIPTEAQRRTAGEKLPTIQRATRSRPGVR